MSLLAFEDVAFRYEGAPLLLDGVQFDVATGEKVGVVGPNGAGKSTILRMIVGRLEPTSGQVVRQRGLRVAYQEQELQRPEGTTVRQEMLRVFADLEARERRIRDVEDRLAETQDPHEQSSLLHRLDRLHEEQRVAGAWSVDQRIASVLSGLGLPEAAWDQPISRFSGGEKNVIALARVLLEDPDLILLDEPSNHLDLDGLEWFARWLRSTDATVVMVSHNRHLLDVGVERILEVDRGGVRSWTGNYTDWQQQKADALALQERQWKNQQRVIQRLEFAARRLRDMAKAYDDPGQARRAKAMMKRLEQMEKVEKPKEGERRFHARLSSGSRSGEFALRIDGLTCGFDERVLVENARLEIRSGDRVALVGPNGSGKTTLFRRILAEGRPENPLIKLGASTRIGDYNQIHSEVMSSAVSLVEWLQERTRLLFQPASELLHRFLFTRDDLERPVSSLSGGEKSRLQLARLVHENANFLMLDEPTNHLDLQACEQLEEMLEDFDGTLLVISHDRYFLDRLVDHVVEISGQRLVQHRGSFTDWFEARRARTLATGGSTLALHSRKGAADRPVGAGAAQEEREAKKARERERRQDRQRVQKLEDQIAKLEAEQQRITAELEAIYSPGGDPGRGPALTGDLARLREALERAYADWEAAAAKVDHEE